MATSSDSRLVQTGLPLVLSSAVLLALPLLGRAYLTDLEYAGWALLMTVVVSSTIFDLGAGVLVQSAGYGRTVSRPVAWRAAGLGCLGALIVTAAAIALSRALGAADVGSTENHGLWILVGATGTAAALRAVWTVQMSILQTTQRFGVRGIAAAIQAYVQVACCWGVLASGGGLWALPVSLAVSSAGALLFARLMLLLRPRALIAGEPSNQMTSLASSRTIASVAGIVASQGDRWVLAAIASPMFLAKYDFALRLASVPLGIAITLFQGITSEAADPRKSESRHRLVLRSTRQLTAVIVATTALTLIGVAVLSQFQVFAIDTVTVLLCVLALAWMGTNGVTAACTYTYLGVGRPWAELAYLVPCTLTLVLGWVLAAGLSWPVGVVFVNTVAIMFWSLWYLRRTLRDPAL